jgi:hypothetical protein
MSFLDPFEGTEIRDRRETFMADLPFELDQL